MKNAEVKLGDKKDNAVEMLEQIEDEWFAQQRSRFKNTTLASHEQRNSNCNKFKLLKDTMLKKRCAKDILHFYLLKIAPPKVGELFELSGEFSDMVTEYMHQADKNLRKAAEELNRLSMQLKGK